MALKAYPCVAMLWALTLPAVGSTQPLSPPEPVEISVMGRLPGPPLWKISDGQHVLWVLPYLDVIPVGLEWDVAFLEKLIAESDEYIARPAGSRGISSPKDPLTLIRVLGLIRKVTHLPKGQTLADVLPAELYGRVRALADQYGLSQKGLEELSPIALKSELVQEILKRENLGTSGPVTQRINKLLKGNRSIRLSDPSHVVNETLSYREIRALIERQDAAKTLEGATACLERHVSYLESALPAVRESAQSWAEGHAHGLFYDASSRDRQMICLKASIPELSSEVETSEAIRKEKWLAAAEAALRNNASTFAVLEINDILDPDGVVARLEKEGYAVTVSALP